MWYSFFKYAILRPVCKYWYRGRLVGAANVPEIGGAVLASNHLSAGETFFLPALLQRRLTFPAKAELFSGRGGLKNRFIAWFLTAIEQIPLDRSGGRASVSGLQPVIEALQAGRLVGIYPEGTRSPDGRLYKGKTGVARLALSAGVPVVPVAVSNTEFVKNWLGIPVLRRPVAVIGEPRDYSAFQGRADDHQVLRWITDDVMNAIRELSGQEYVDVYGTAVKSGRMTPEAILAKIRPRPGTSEPPGEPSRHLGESG